MCVCVCESFFQSATSQQMSVTLDTLVETGRFPLSTGRMHARVMSETGTFRNIKRTFLKFLPGWRKKKGKKKNLSSPSSFSRYFSNYAGASNAQNQKTQSPSHGGKTHGPTLETPSKRFSLLTENVALTFFS